MATSKGHCTAVKAKAVAADGWRRLSAPDDEEAIAGAGTSVRL